MICLSARTVPLRIAYTLAISLLLLAAPAAAKTDALLAPDNTLAAATWSGQWASEWGTMQLTQSGARVEGTYPHDQGDIAGSVSGNVFTGRWDEAPSRAGPGDAGTVILTLAADGKSFTGRWNYEGDQTFRTDWNGRCIGGACTALVTPLPPKPPAAEVKAAVSWSQGQVGSTRWAGRCQAFVQSSYATSGYKTAAEAASKIGLRQGSIATVPRGALIYFGANCPGVTGKAGHVGISLGNGQMISALGKVAITNLKKNTKWKSAYSGWTYPPAKWPGRKP